MNTTRSNKKISKTLYCTLQTQILANTEETN
jgi:hypothetical protein